MKLLFTLVLLCILKIAVATENEMCYVQSIFYGEVTPE